MNITFETAWDSLKLEVALKVDEMKETDSY